MIDKYGTLLHIGKAKNLHKRLNSRLQAIVSQIDTIETIF